MDPDTWIFPYAHIDLGVNTDQDQALKILILKFKILKHNIADVLSRDVNQHYLNTYPNPGNFLYTYPDLGVNTDPYPSTAIEFFL